MKRFIDFLTLVTIVLTVFATSWSIDSFGQTSKLDAPLTIVLEHDIFSHLTYEVHKDDLGVTASRYPAINLAVASTCKTFEFLGNVYFQKPEDHYRDSCLANRPAMKGYFRFMGEYYPDLPEEEVTLNFSY